VAVATELQACKILVNHGSENAGGVIGFTEDRRDPPTEKDDSHASDGLESFSLSAAAIGCEEIFSRRRDFAAGSRNEFRLTLPGSDGLLSHSAFLQATQ